MKMITVNEINGAIITADKIDARTITTGQRVIEKEDRCRFCGVRLERGKIGVCDRCGGPC